MTQEGTEIAAASREIRRLPTHFGGTAAETGGQRNDESGRNLEHAGILQQKKQQKREENTESPQGQTDLCSHGICICDGLPLRANRSRLGAVNRNRSGSGISPR